MSYIDIPKFKVSPKPERFLVDKILVLIILGALLYIGIYVNYYLLNQMIPTVLNWIFIIIILIILIIDALLCYMSYGHYNYEFHDNRMLINDGHISEIKYVDVKQLSYASNILDRLMKTGSISLTTNDGKKIKLKYLYNSNQLYFWLQKVIKPQ